LFATEHLNKDTEKLLIVGIGASYQTRESHRSEKSHTSLAQAFGQVSDCRRRPNDWSGERLSGRLWPRVCKNALPGYDNGNIFSEVAP
jgi:hypothetical protein